MRGAVIRRLRSGDFESWHRLFHQYLEFYREELEQDVVRETFSRLVAERGSLFGLIALSHEDEPVGIVNCVMHATTWSKGPTCYLEDLFVVEAARGTGLARHLIAQAKQEASRRGGGRIYWHTQAFNGRARSLYDQVARLTSLVVYEEEL
jgi:GNAT superfamily N-acetyltransferase